MLRNLKIRNKRPLNPLRHWVNTTGPLESSLINSAVASINGESSTRPTLAPTFLASAPTRSSRHSRSQLRGSGELAGTEYDDGWGAHCYGLHAKVGDKVADKVASLRKGNIPIYEPGLDKLVVDNVRAGRLAFDTSLAEAVGNADAVFIAVGTPTRRGDGHADLTYVRSAAAEIAEALRGYTVVVVKSTVPVGTGREVSRIIREARPEAEFDVVANPEFLREGAAIEDFMKPDRVIIGVETNRARDVR